MDQRFYKRHKQNYDCDILYKDVKYRCHVMNSSSEGFMLRLSIIEGFNCNDSIVIYVDTYLDGQHIQLSYELSVKHMSFYYDKYMVIGCHIERLLEDFVVA